MLQLLFATGMRVSELIQLDIKNVDFETGILSHIGNVSKHPRELVLTHAMLQLLYKYIENSRSSFLQQSHKESALFLNHRGYRLSRQGFWLILKGYAKSTDIADISPHMLRHVFAFSQLQNGVELQSLQQMLGHLHIASTQVYKRISPVSKVPSPVPAKANY